MNYSNATFKTMIETNIGYLAYYVKLGIQGVDIQSGLDGLWTLFFGLSGLIHTMAEG
jgi:hypothetical protein